MLLPKGLKAHVGPGLWSERATGSISILVPRLTVTAAGMDGAVLGVGGVLVARWHNLI